MKYRKLRIAWSVFWGLAAVLLIVLWVRSYWYSEWINYSSPPSHLRVYCNRGVGGINWAKIDPRSHGTVPLLPPGWSHQTHPTFSGDMDKWQWVWQSNYKLVAAPMW